MSSNDEIYKIILKAEGEEKLAALVTRLRQAEEQLKANVAALGKADAATVANAQAVARLADQVKVAQKELSKVGGTAGNAANLLTQVGYAADDVQYGFKGIANNIQPLLSAIPALAALAGPISIAAIAAYQLYEHWDQISKLWGQGHAKTQAEEMEELEKKTAKTADEMARLVQLQMQQRNAKAQQGPTTAQSARESAVNDAVKEAPYGKAHDAVGEIHGGAFKASIDQRLMDEVARKQEAYEHSLNSQPHKNARAPGTGDADVATAAQDLQDAKKKVDDAYNEMIANFLATLGKDQATVKAFVAKLRSNGKYNQLADKLEQANKSPQDKADEAENAAAESEARDANSATAAREEAERVRERDEEERQQSEARKIEDDHASKKAQAEEQVRREREAKAESQLGGGRLGKLAATGQLRDHHVSQGLRDLGHGEDDIAAMTPNIAARLREKGNDEAKTLAGKAGITVGEAQRRIAVQQGKDDFEPFKQHADTVNDIFKRAADARQSPSQVIDSAGLANSIQAGVGAKDPALQQVEELKKANEVLMKILNKADNPIGILGP